MKLNVFCGHLGSRSCLLKRQLLLRRPFAHLYGQHLQAHLWLCAKKKPVKNRWGRWRVESKYVARRNMAGDFHTGEKNNNFKDSMALKNNIQLHNRREATAPAPLRHSPSEPASTCVVAQNSEGCDKMGGGGRRVSSPRTQLRFFSLY